MSKAKKKLIDNLQRSIKLSTYDEGHFFVSFLKIRYSVATLKTQTQMLPFYCQLEIRANKKPLLKVSRMALDQASLVWSQGGSNP